MCDVDHRLDCAPNVFGGVVEFGLAGVRPGDDRLDARTSAPERFSVDHPTAPWTASDKAVMRCAVRT